jgi:hypothetical protein
VTGEFQARGGKLSGAINGDERLQFPGKAATNPFSGGQATPVRRFGLYGSEPYECCCSQAMA